MQRDAMHTGRASPTSTPRIRRSSRRRARTSPSSRKTRTSRSRSPTTRRCPEAKTWLHHSWSGDLLGAAFYYMPKGVSPDVLSYWSPDANGVVQNDFLFVPRTAKKPALAHHFLNFMLDEKNAYNNFVQFVGYTPPQKTIDADALIKKGLIPEDAHGRRRSARPVLARTRSCSS